MDYNIDSGQLLASSKHRIVPCRLSVGNKAPKKLLEALSQSTEKEDLCRFDIHLRVKLKYYTVAMRGDMVYGKLQL